ncbi:MAG: hypothetical protein HY780_11090, partial [Chloroflexi bacterium]|nr:hypothetical protein [Chloroflexota bacterium]
MNKLIAKATLFCLLALLGLVFLFWDTNPLRANVNANLLAQAKKTRAVRPTKTPTQEHNVPPMIYPETNAEEIPETTDPNELASPLAETFAFYQNLSGIKVSSPYGVVVTPKGQVLMVDGKNKRVCVFDLFDHYVAPCFGKGQLTGPYGIAVDRSNGDIYITDYDGNKIFKYDANFNLLKSWGKAGTGKGK